MSKVEQAHLKAYSRIFAQEFRKRGLDVTPEQERKYLYTLLDKRYTLNLNLQVGQRTVAQKSENFDEAGIIFYHPIILGEIEEKFAFVTDFRWGVLINREKYIPQPDETIYRYDNFSQASSMETYAKIGLPWLSLQIGKDDLYWGPGRHGALMLSDNSDSKDMLKFEGCMGPFNLVSFFALLRDKRGNKYMSGHRLELSLADKLSLGLDEIVIYADRFELSYLNPFTIYIFSLPMTEYGLEGGYGYGGDNALTGADLNFRIAPKFELYSEVMLDDYHFETPLDYRNWDNKFGVLLGVYHIDPFSFQNTDFRIEYAFVNQYAYTHEKPIYTYTNRERIIGHYIGPDADDLWVELKHWFTDKIQVGLAYELLRHGEGNINKPHQPNDPEEWEFLSGITESTHSLSLKCSYFSIGNYSLSAEYKYSWIKNSKHQLSVDDSKQQLLVELEYRF